MHKDETPSIFSEYYKAHRLVDRFEKDCARAIDVIIPIIHTNEFWRANLMSIYREIPVNRLLLGDGGCIDDSIDIAKQFPRVEVLDHRNFTSLGFSIRHLIEATETEWFVYLHSDVFLPPGWFDAMSAHRGDYDWFECNQRITVLADYLLDTTKVRRSYSGSQMGRKAAFEKVTPLIDDDFLYRNEDIIFERLLERQGFRYGKVGETHHFHQVMYKPSRWHRAIKRISIEPDISHDEDVRANRTYAKGMIKYLNPSELAPDLIDSVRSAVARLTELKDTSGSEFVDWARKTNPLWVSEISSDQPKTVTSRNLIADRIQLFADMYRLHGARRAMMFALSYLIRSTFAILMPRTVFMTVQSHLLTVRGASRRIGAVYSQDGIVGILEFTKKKYSSK